MLSLCVFAVVSGCAVFVTPNTTVRAENSLTAMSITYNNTTTQIDGIDLANVTIGDVSFASIPYGTTTHAVTTNRSGTVNVTFGTVYVVTTVFGVQGSTGFSNISPMTADITSGTENTVVFDQHTASDIINAIAAKKKAQ